MYNITPKHAAKLQAVLDAHAAELRAAFGVSHAVCDVRTIVNDAQIVSFGEVDQHTKQPFDLEVLLGEGRISSDMPPQPRPRSQWKEMPLGSKGCFTWLRVTYEASTRVDNEALAELVFHLAQWTMPDLEVRAAGEAEGPHVHASTLAPDIAKHAAFTQRFGPDDIRGAFNAGDGIAIERVSADGGILKVTYTSLNVSLNEPLFLYFGMIAKQRGYHTIVLSRFGSETRAVQDIDTRAFTASYERVHRGEVDAVVVTSKHPTVSGYFHFARLDRSYEFAITYGGSSEMTPYLLGERDRAKVVCSRGGNFYRFELPNDLQPAQLQTLARFFLASDAPLAEVSASVALQGATAMSGGERLAFGMSRAGSVQALDLEALAGDKGVHPDVLPNVIFTEPDRPLSLRLRFTGRQVAVTTRGVVTRGLAGYVVTVDRVPQTLDDNGELLVERTAWTAIKVSAGDFRLFLKPAVSVS